jgi:signal transduction histidine kinase
MSPPNDNSHSPPGNGSEGSLPDRADSGPFRFPSTATAQPPSGSDPSDAAHAQLAHELANLLDGGMRNLGLAMSSLRVGPKPPTTPDDEDLLRRLQSANAAMQHMAKLIHRWMANGKSPGLHDDPRSLAESLESALRLLGPAAKAHQISLHVEIDEAAANLPAGPVYPIVANAIRNSIEAIADSRATRDRRIEVLVRRIDAQIELTIRDSGPGVRQELFDAHGGLRFGVTTKATGHGVGLSLSRDLVRNLGGTLTLTNRRPHGAELVVRLPATRN